MKKLFWVILLIIIILLLIFCFLMPKKWKNVRLTFSEGRSTNPVLVWDGKGYGITWMDDRDRDIMRNDIYFAKIDKNGNKLTSEVNISNNPNSRSIHHDIGWTGTEYGVIWDELIQGSCYLYFARFDSNGNKIGNNIQLISTISPYCPGGATIEWTGSEYGISWQMRPSAPGVSSQIYFNRLSASGQMLGYNIDESERFYGYKPSLIQTDLQYASGSDYGLAWMGFPGQAIVFKKIDNLGTERTEEFMVNNVGSAGVGAPSLTWNNSDLEYGLTWQSMDITYKKEIYFARVDKDGNKIGNETKIVDTLNEDYPINPSMVWADARSEYGFVWQKNTKTPRESWVQFVSLDAEGNMKCDIVRISNDTIPEHATTTGHARNPKINWNGKNYAMVWDSTRDLNDGEEIYFAQSSYCPIINIFMRIKNFITGLF